jgi:4a-hydroxytetrahydrobiopterin dehydratase
MTSAGRHDAAAARRALAAAHCRPGAARLSTAETEAQLCALPGWTFTGSAIVKTFRFSRYAETIAFVNAIAAIAEREDHHPDLSVHYDQCVVAWSTHSAGGVTLNDVVCAAQVDGLRQ